MTNKLLYVVPLGLLAQCGWGPMVSETALAHFERKLLLSGAVEMHDHDNDHDDKQRHQHKHENHNSERYLLQWRLAPGRGTLNPARVETRTANTAAWVEKWRSLQTQQASKLPRLGL